MAELMTNESKGPRKSHVFDALVGLLTAWIRPATATRRTNNVPLPIAFATHCVAAFALVMCIALIDSLGPPVRWEWGDLLNRWRGHLGFIFFDSIRYPLESALMVGGIELGILVLAILIAAWGAQDEPMADSFRHAIRRTWLHCGHVVIATLLTGGVIVALGLIQYHRTAQIQRATAHLIHPHYLSSSSSKMERAENTAMWDNYQKQYAMIERRIPPSLTLGHEDKIISFAYMSALIWVLAALMRGVAAERSHRRQPDEFLCRECGYNLVATELESRCPECGRPVRLSIGPAGDAAPPWQHAKRLWQLPGAYLRTVWQASRKTRSLALGLSMPPVNQRYRWFLALNLLFCGLAALLINLTTFLIPYVHRDDDILWIVTPWMAAIWTLLLLVLLLFCAMVVGIAARVRTGRNRFGAINQLACYFGGYLIFWTVVFWSAVGVIVLFYDNYKAWCREMRIPEETPLLLGLGIFNLLMAIGLLINLWRASSGVRYLMSPPLESSPAIGIAPDNLASRG